MKTIAIDAMGGDFGPEITVPAALSAITQFNDLHLILVGDEATLTSALATHQSVDSSRIVIHHASEVVGMDESPVVALRSKKDSSMRVAVNLVKDGQAQAAVSAGNTGALMAISRYVLKTLPGVDRPAILSRFPTTKGDRIFRMLDLGANVDSTPEQLLQFALLGSLLTQAVDNNPSPKVALLNIGEEDIKGNEQVKEAAHLLSQSPLIQYTGYIEACDLFKGDVDVVVCDGFVGNVSLKTMEGTANLFKHYTQQSFAKNWLTRLGGLFAIPAMNCLKQHLDPAKRNGASFIGLNGTVVKSHGSATSEAFFYAIKEALHAAQTNSVEYIRAKLAEQVIEPEAS